MSEYYFVSEVLCDVVVFIEIVFLEIILYLGYGLEYYYYNELF